MWVQLFELTGYSSLRSGPALARWRVSPGGSSFASFFKLGDVFALAKEAKPEATAEAVRMHRARAGPNEVRIRRERKQCLSRSTQHIFPAVILLQTQIQSPP